MRCRVVSGSRRSSDPAMMVTMSHAPLFLFTVTLLSGSASCTKAAEPRPPSISQPVSVASSTRSPACPPGTEGTWPSCNPLPDRDGDGVADRFDSCPEKPGAASLDKAVHGCPPPDRDADKDGLLDSADACPHESGPDVPDDPAARGCPRHVRVAAAAIVLVSPIQFNADRDSLRPESMTVIDDLARVLIKHPEIALVEIRGHLNARRENYGVNLSQKRAESVRAALAARGVEPARLVAKGYGDSVPLALPDTEEGKLRNARIEIVILERRSRR